MIEAQKMQKMRFDYIFIMFKTQLRAKHPGPSENKNAEARFRPVGAKGQALGRWRIIIMLLRLCVEVPQNKKVDLGEAASGGKEGSGGFGLGGGARGLKRFDSASLNIIIIINLLVQQ